MSRSILSILRNLLVLINLSFISTICSDVPVRVGTSTGIICNIAQYLLIGIIQYQNTYGPSRVKFMIDEDKTECFIPMINICQGLNRTPAALDFQS